MKEPIEELFKQSLKGHEMPFNPDAWKAMNARLDVVSPVATPTSYLKYYLGAAGIGVAAVATYFIFAGGNTTENNSTPVAKETRTEQSSSLDDAKSNQQKQTIKSSTSNSETQTDDTSVIVAPSETSSSSNAKVSHANTAQGNANVDGNNKVASSAKDQDASSKQGQNGGNSNTTNEGSNGTKPTTDYSNTVKQKMILPEVPNLCLNEEVSITNPNDDPIAVYDALNKHVLTIPAKKSVIFKPTVVGNYHLQYADNYVWKTGSHFQVNRVPDADFMIDLVNKYENGMPLTHVEAIGGQGTYTWKAKNQSATGIEADLHFYKKGEQTIELTVNDGRCASTVEKTIYIEEDYNLMAVTGFSPLSTVPSNSTFMPFALTQRNVNFSLVIMDSRDGGIVYETTDASLPWDGTDIRSGKRSQAPQVYVWKAVILNPAPNEPGEYRGTITMN